MGWTSGVDDGDKKCSQNFLVRSSWKKKCEVKRVLREGVT